MDNVKTGELIRTRRRELGLTQLELAQKLNITDRAVSKWERGLSAPDIALLEPLGDALNLTVSELIRGELSPAAEEESVRQTLDYARGEVKKAAGRVRNRSLTAAALLLLLALWGSVKLWNTGLFCTVERCPSPTGENVVTVYGKEFGDWLEFSFRDGTATVMNGPEGDGYTRIQYRNTEYRGLWWSPDGRKYVIALHYPDTGEDYLALNWLEYHRQSNLNAYLSMGVEASELRQYGYAKAEGWPEIHYEFLQWAADSSSMLIYYTFEDEQATNHEGYFWYNCVTGRVKAVLELSPDEK